MVLQRFFTITYQKKMKLNPVKNSIFPKSNEIPEYGNYYTAFKCLLKKINRMDSWSFIMKLIEHSMNELQHDMRDFLYTRNQNKGSKILQVPISSGCRWHYHRKCFDVNNEFSGASDFFINIILPRCQR